MTSDTTKTLAWESRKGRRWTAWLGSAAGALGMNLLLFAAMPHLQRPMKAAPAFEGQIHQVQVIRIKKPERPVQRRSEPPPKPPAQNPPRPLPQAPLQARLSLPFAINPRLPKGPGTLALPALPEARIDTSAMGAFFSAGELDRPLTILARIPPVYPLQAKRRGIEGWVRVRFVVTETGAVSDISIVESKPPEIFDQSVRRCVAGWRFQPGSVDGIAVRTRAETTVRFSLE
jgi:periplasmic protein TonB